MNAKLNHLKIDLKKFGLNPLDWKLQQVKPSSFKIANIKDRDFYFFGETQPDGPRLKWTVIHLASF